MFLQISFGNAIMDFRRAVREPHREKSWPPPIPLGWDLAHGSCNSKETFIFLSEDEDGGKRETTSLVQLTGGKEASVLIV